MLHARPFHYNVNALCLCVCVPERIIEHGGNIKSISEEIYNSEERVDRTYPFKVTAAGGGVVSYCSSSNSRSYSNSNDRISNNRMFTPPVSETSSHDTDNGTDQRKKTLSTKA